MAKNRSSIIVLVIVFLGTLFFSYNIIGIVRNKIEFDKKKKEYAIMRCELEREASNFTGKAGVLIKDLDHGFEIKMGGDDLFPSASLVKVPIMAAYFYAIHEKVIDPEEKIRISSSNRVGGSGVLKNQRMGEEFSVGELIDLMITESDNTAANMLIERAGFDYLNALFKKFGLKDTNLSRNMMDFQKRRMGIENFTSARDCALLLEKIYDGALVNKTVSSNCLDLLKGQKIRDRIPARLPQDVLVAHKTGLENSVCHDTGIVFAPGGDFIICVLTKHHDKNSRNAKRFISRVALITYRHYKEL